MTSNVEKEICELMKSSGIGNGSRKRIKICHTENLPTFVCKKYNESTEGGGDENSDPKRKASVYHNKSNLKEVTDKYIEAFSDVESGEEIERSCVRENLGRQELKKPEEEEYNEYISRVRSHVDYLNNKDDDDEQLFSVRAKLFEFVQSYDYDFESFSSHLYPCNKKDGPARWTQRGIGYVKFMRHLEEGITYGTVRITMHHEGTQQCLMDQLMEHGVDASSTRDGKGRKLFMWTTGDNALGNDFPRTFALRFGSDRDALAWKDHFEKAKLSTSNARLRLDPSCYGPPVEPESPARPSILCCATTFPITPNPKSASAGKTRQIRV